MQIPGALMEVLQKLGIRYPLGPSGTNGTKPAVVDPSDADDYFMRLLIPILMEGQDGADLIVGAEPDGILWRFSAVCRSYSRRSPGMSGFWQSASDFWSLLSTILPGIPEVHRAKLGSMQAIVQSFLESSPDLVHLLRVKEWLEQCAGPFIPAEVRKAPVPLTSDGTCHLDPDSNVPLRDPLDVHWEAAQLKTLWDLLRRGKLQEAIAWCFQVDQPWRAAILSGGFLSSDPLLDGQDGLVLSGNPDRSAWRESVRRLIESPGISDTERAVYGCLVGDVKAMQPLCQDWKDALWASTLSIIEDQIHQITLQATRLDMKLAVPPIPFEAIEQRFSPASDPVYPLMRALMERKDLGQVAFNCLNGSTDEFVCLATLSSLILQSFGTVLLPQYLDVLIHAYMTRLLQSDQVSHCFFLCSRLTADELRTDSLVTVLESILAKPKEAKWTLLREARSYGLPLNVPLWRLAGTRNEMSNDVLEVLLFAEAKDGDTSLRPLLIEYCASLVRASLLKQTVGGAKKILSDLPLSLYASYLQEPSVGPFVKELVSYRHLLQVLSLYETWASAYTASLAGPSTPALGHMSTELVQSILGLVQSDWLGDVERVDGSLFEEERESQLIKLRSRYLTELTLIALATGDKLVGRVCEVIADGRLELWIEYQREGALQSVIDRLQTMPVGDESVLSAVSILRDKQRTV